MYIHTIVELKIMYCFNVCFLLCHTHNTIKGLFPLFNLPELLIKKDFFYIYISFSAITVREIILRFFGFLVCLVCLKLVYRYICEQRKRVLVAALKEIEVNADIVRQQQTEEMNKSIYEEIDESGERLTP